MLKARYWMPVVALALAWTLRPAGAQAAETAGLPEPVLKAVRAAFPNAVVRSFGRETEHGVRYYEVNLCLGGNRIEVEVDRYGGIGEIERVIALDEAPTALRDAIEKALQGEGTARIERHERWGRARMGRFQKLSMPTVFYEVKLTMNGVTREVKWRPGGVEKLPAQVLEAIRTAFSGAVIVEAGAEDEDGLKIYEVGLLLNGQDIEAEVSSEGTLVEVSTQMPIKDLPEAVVAVIAKAAPGATVVRAEKCEARAAARDGQWVPLDPPTVTYEVRLHKDDTVAEVEVSAAGTLLDGPKWEKRDDHHDHDDDDDDNNDDD